jgi:alkanesulfonate monooxygenase SsuD/methylene tetrahydromethanopterin reductase-like flavin-dependent oxidoreductase (luciferase family)
MLKIQVSIHFGLWTTSIKYRLVGNPQEPMLKSWTTISFLAGVTSKIKLETLVSGVIYKDPSILAKSAATLDVLSNGSCSWE